MLSLRAKLHGLGGHLPEGFKASGGIKRLFPKGYAGSITMLKNYVFLFDSGTATDVSSDSGSQISQGQIWMGADGAGRWFLGWWNDDSAGGGWGVNVRYQAGFVFRFSNDGFAHGYVDTSEPDGGATSCNSGVDPWISEHWPQAFAANVEVDLQDAAGFDSLPPESNIWTNAGFPASNFTTLQGGNCQCASNLLALFPFSDFFIGETAPEAVLPLPFSGSNPFSGYSSGDESSSSGDDGG